VNDSPLSRTADAKRHRDLAAEVSILTDANADLESQPWYPLQPGDVVLLAMPGGPEFYGETYVGRNDGFETVLECVSATEAVQAVEVSFYDLWFEAGPDVLTIIRAGRVVFGTPVAERDGQGNAKQDGSE
jgi:protein involved in polysaccharide export with SLBB domain